MLCIGYGQFPPQTVCEAMWTIFSMFVGSVLWAVFIGSLTSYQETLDQDNSNFKEKQVQVEEWMNFRRLPQKLRQQVFTYLEIKFRGNLFSEHDILKELNPLLKKEVMKFNCMKLHGGYAKLSRKPPKMAINSWKQLKTAKTVKTATKDQNLAFPNLKDQK